MPQPTIRMLLESRTLGEREAFTVASDQLASRGYLDRDERIELSSVIGDALGAFGDAVAPAVADRPVEAGDARSIADRVKAMMGD